MPTRHLCGGALEEAAMLIARRALAVLAGLLLAPVLFVALVTWRAADTVGTSDFYRDQVRALDLGGLAHETLFPEAVGSFLERQEERLPEGLEAVDLPADAEAQTVLTGLLTSAFPKTYINETAEAAAGDIGAYLTGASDDLEVRVGLAEPLAAVAAHEPGEPSALRQAWRELDLGETAVRGLVTAYAEREAAEAGIDLTVEEDSVLLDAYAAELDGAAGWVETQLFAAIDELRPYLAGESDHFDVRVSFEEHPMLAGPLAAPLRADEATLLADGYRASDGDLVEALEASGRDALSDVDRALSIFRGEGLVITADDLQATTTESEGRVRDGLDLQRMRDGVVLVRGVVRWVAATAALVLVLLVGALGGRAWTSRVAWASGALLLAALASFAAAGPVYEATAGARIEAAFEEQRASGPDETAMAALQDAILVQAESVADGFASDVAFSAAIVALLAALALGSLLVWRIVWSGAQAPEPEDERYPRVTA